MNLQEASDLGIVIAGQSLKLSSQRAVFWENRKTLILSDLHWGKSEALQRAGIPLPSSPFADDLARLSQLLLRYPTTRVLILGDLIHHPSGMTPALIAQISAWRKDHAFIPFLLVRGNHDRKIPMPEDWQIRDVGSLIEEPPFRFMHDPFESVSTEAEAKGRWTWGGHIHPYVSFGRGFERLRLPCFFLRQNRMIVPAFGSLTGGFRMKLESGDRAFAIVEDQVIDLGGGMGEETKGGAEAELSS